LENSEKSLAILKGMTFPKNGEASLRTPYNRTIIVTEALQLEAIGGLVQNDVAAVLQVRMVLGAEKGQLADLDIG